VKTPLKILAILLCAVLSSCENYRNAVRGFGHGLGAIMITDIHHAQAWEEAIYKNGGYTKSEVEIIPGAGRTHIIIHRVHPGESPEAMAQNIRQTAARAPEVFGPVEVIIAPR
jgi:predicted small secreted protein